MKNIKSHFRFNKQERSGIFFLLFIIIALQAGYFIYKSSTAAPKEATFTLDNKTQAQIDSLKLKTSKKDSIRIYPFNPNFISDFKGYNLGMTVDEIDRLHAFRKTNSYVNSAEEFQEVTKISDSLLAAISPYFKFPEWTRLKSRPESKEKKAKPLAKITPKQIKDLNAATSSELRSIPGIGETLSARIVKFRNRLGGFLIDEQLYDVYGLDGQVAERVLHEFKVLKKPSVVKININTASSYEISRLVYIPSYVAESIVEYRRVNGAISSFDELHNIDGFPTEKIERIALYLQL